MKGRLDLVNILDNPKALNDVQFVIEAVSEDLNIKEKVFKTLDEHTPADAILSTNTSSISITKIGSFTKRPDKVIGMHFMNPVPVMKGLEVIRGLATADATLETTLALGKAMRKVPTICEKDTP